MSLLIQDIWCNETGVQCPRGCNDGFCRAYNEARIGPMPQTTRERQEALRARRLMLGMTEVRGVYLHPSLHAELKAYAKKLAKKKATNGTPLANDQ
jgi:hypothetical protein